MSATTPTVKVGITASHDGGNIELISQSEPVISAGGRTAKITVKIHVKPGKLHIFNPIHQTRGLIKSIAIAYASIITIAIILNTSRIGMN